MSNDDWEKIVEKYGGLMVTISTRISGDPAISQLEDNLQDVRRAGLEAVIGYEKQNNGANGTFEEFFETKGFDKYFKTCLWNAKNKKGASIAKGYGIRNGSVPFTVEAEELIADKSCSSGADSYLQTIREITTEKQRNVIKVITDDPYAITDTGRINISRVAHVCGLSWEDVRITIKSLRHLLKAK
jgi:hypothetical protein